jgi:hypothetical protein
VEWEFEQASETAHLELMAFPKEPAEDQVVEEKQRTFLGKLGRFVTGRWIKPFRDRTDLVAVVSDSLEKWLIRRSNALSRRARRARRRSRQLLVVGVAALLVLVLVGGILAAVGWLSIRAGLCLLLTLGVVAVLGALLRWGMEEGDDE